LEVLLTSTSEKHILIYWLLSGLGHSFTDFWFRCPKRKYQLLLCGESEAWKDLPTSDIGSEPRLVVFFYHCQNELLTFDLENFSPQSFTNFWFEVNCGWSTYLLTFEIDAASWSEKRYNCWLPRKVY